MMNCLEEMGVGGRDIWYDRGCRYEISWGGGLYNGVEGGRYDDYGRYSLGGR